MDLVPIYAGKAEETARDEPVAGSYWRAKQDVPRKVRTVPYQRYRSRDGDPVEIATREEVAREALPGGTVLLLRTAHVLEGRVHSVVTSPDPKTAGDVSRQWMLDEFLDAMEPLDDGEAAALRQGQVGATLGQIAELRAEMAQIARAASQDSAQVRLIAPPSSAGPKALVAVQKEAAELRATALAKRSEQIAAVNVRMQAEVATLARLQGEQADSALASVQDALDVAVKARQTMESLDLFSGDKIETVRLTDGPGAPDGTKVMIYQNRLFLDEEVAVHLDVGGFGHEDVPDLGHYLESVPGLLERLVPAERGVVLVRIRRRDRAAASSTLSGLLKALEDAKADRTQFLLFRDGRRAHLTFAETALQEAERLFPTKDELDRPFRGSGAESIGYDDVRYVKALGEFERQALVYKRLLILLWGLEFSEERPLGRIDLRREAGDWTSQAWQAEHVEFVPDDASRSLPRSGPSVQEWLAENRRALTKGSRVVVRWSDAIDPKSAPTCERYEWSRGEERLITMRDPAEPVSVATVREVDGRLTVTAKVIVKKTGKLTTAPVWIEPNPESFIVLDTLDEAEMNDYAESRLSRTSYLTYLGLLRTAREALKTEMPAIRAIDTAIAAEMADAYRTHPPEAIARAVRRSHILLRAQQAGKPAEARQRKGVIATAAMILGGAPGADAIAQAAGVSPAEVLRSGFDGFGRLDVVAEAPDDPLAPRGAWVRRIQVESDPSGAWREPTCAIGTIPRDHDPSIYQRHADPVRLPLARAASALPEGIASPDDTAVLLAAIAAATPAAIRDRHSLEGDAAKMVARWNADARRLTFHQRPAGTEGVVSVYEHTVIGAVVRRKGDGKRHPLMLLSVSTDPLVDALIIDPTVEPDVRDALVRLYKNGGGWRLDEVRRRARAMARAPERRFQIFVSPLTGSLGAAILASGSPHARDHGSSSSLVSRDARDSGNAREWAWKDLASGLRIEGPIDTYGRTRAEIRNRDYALVANRDSLSWMAAAHDMGAPLLGDIEYRWAEA